MTILPKKKETKKAEPDHESETRRQRNWAPSHPSPRSAGGRSPSGDHEYTLSYSPPPSPTYNLSERETLERHHSRASSTFYSQSTSRSPQQDKPTIEEPTEDGYNSSDEHQGEGKAEGMSFQREVAFEKLLNDKKGFTVKKMAPDGACLFRAVADQVYGDQEMHSVVRKHCMDYMSQDRDYFSTFVTEDFNSYIHRKRKDHTHGNQVEMQAMSEIYSRPIEVYQYSADPMNTFHSRTSSSLENPPIRLSYHGRVHYNSIVDPVDPTVGIGLGIAGYKTRQQQLDSAVKESEQLHLEQEMLEDKKNATDWEATDEHLAELVARESYAQWLKDNQKKSSASGTSTSSSTISKRPTSAESTSSSSLLMKAPGKGNSPVRRHSPPPVTTAKPYDTVVSTSKRSPQPSAPSPVYLNTSSEWQSSFATGLDSGFPDWNDDDDSVLAAVLAQSEREYMEAFSRTPQTVQISPSRSPQTCGRVSPLVSTAGGNNPTVLTSNSNSSATSLLDVPES